MLENLTNNEIALLTELVIHHGMYRYEKDSPRYTIYYKMAGELLEELIKRKSSAKHIRLLTGEFIEAQLKYVPEGGMPK